ncbi:MAG: tetratricopeptide repeat protein, partial [Vicinamibacterales bacterium]
MPRRPRWSSRVFGVLAVLGFCAALHAQSATPSRRTASGTWLRDAEAAIAHGKRADAERLASTRGASDPLAAVVLAELDDARGKYQDAQTLLEPIAAREPTGEAALQLALLYRTTGKTAEADRLLTAVLDAGSGSSDPAALFRAGRAAHALDRAKDAETLDLAAERAGADKIAVETELGGLFLEKYNPVDALKSYTIVLAADPQWAPADAGLARVLADDDPDKAAAAAAKAVTIDPDLDVPHLLLATLDIDQDHDADATAELNKVLAVNPSDLEAHAILAAMAYVKDNTAAYESEVASVLQVNPHDGEVYR